MSSNIYNSCDQENDQRTPVFVALDFASSDEMWKAINPLAGRVSGVKVGMELFYNSGPRIVEELADKGWKVFLDLKLHDIPHTVYRAIKALSPLPFSLLTVHASGGREMLKAAKEAINEFMPASSSVESRQLLAVTVLTSLSQLHLHELQWEGSLLSRVLTWATVAQQAGCDGVVCSPHEASALRQTFPRPFLLVTPGIRIERTQDDQQRVTTPQEALKWGADYLVMGRSLFPHPESVLQQCFR